VEAGIDVTRETSGVDITTVLFLYYRLAPQIMLVVNSH
jgi:hypothetical protein